MMATCSFNEWDQLEEIIVGSVIGAQRMAFEAALGAYYDPDPESRKFAGALWEDGQIVEAQAQLDGLAQFLSSRGISVRRPEPFPEKRGFSTPDFSVPFGNCYACPRDVLLVIGD